MKLQVKEYVQQEKEKLKRKYNEPIRKMLIIQVGDDKASNAYIKGKITDAAELGHQAMLMKFPDGVYADEIYEFLKDNISHYDGVILQEPANIKVKKCKLYPITKRDIIDLIDDWKDIDGFKKTSHYKPATPRGIMDYAAAMGHGDLRSKVVAVVGER